MSNAIQSVSSNNQNFDAASSPSKQPSKPSVADEIKQLASQGHTAHTISQTTGLPETLVATELGTTSTNSTSTSQASAVLALGARLSVQA